MGRKTSVGIVPRGTYDFTGLREGVASFPLAQRIDVADAQGLALALWVHEGHFPSGASFTLHVASDGHTGEVEGAFPLQTRTATGEAIAAFTVDAQAALPLYQVVPVPAAHVGLLLGILLEVRGGRDGGPRFALTADLVIDEAARGAEAAPMIEPIVTSPQKEELGAAALGRIAAAAQLVAAKPLRRYPRWREIVA